MGGSQSQEFMVYTDAGEDLIASCASCGYAANIEKATSKLALVEDLIATSDKPEEIHTPGQKTIEEVGAFLKTQPVHQLKTLVYTAIATDGSTRGVVIYLRGDHQLNEAKLNGIAAAAELRPATAEEIEKIFKASAGYLGPIGIEAAPHPKKPGTLVILDSALEGRKNLIAGANKDEYHLRNVTPARDFKPTLTADVRNINEGEPCPACGTALKLGKAVEIGHIFKLGYKYSKSMGASVLDKDGKEVTPIMGSYGIGIERILTAAIESSAAKFANASASPELSFRPESQRSGDAVEKPATRLANNGETFALSPSIAPFHVVVTITNVREPDLLAAGEKVAAALDAAGIDTLLDDRDERAGVKFKDADLIGVPFRIAIGKKLAEGKVELLNRLTNQTEDVPTTEVTFALSKLLGTPRL
jgi:prolyl-tRNA synthetase